MTQVHIVRCGVSSINKVRFDDIVNKPTDQQQNSRDRCSYLFSGQNNHFYKHLRQLDLQWNVTRNILLIRTTKTKQRQETRSHLLFVSSVRLLLVQQLVGYLVDSSLPRFLLFIALPRQPWQSTRSAYPNPIGFSSFRRKILRQSSTNYADKQSNNCQLCPSHEDIRRLTSRPRTKYRNLSDSSFK